MKKMDCFVLRRSLIAVSIAVVSIRLSIEIPGVSRSNANSSISSNSIMLLFKAMSLRKTYRILAATLESPSARKDAVSITQKSKPMRSARASQIVVFAVPGGPNKTALYAAPYDGLSMEDENGVITRSSNTDFSVRTPSSPGLPRSLSKSLSQFSVRIPLSEKRIPENSSITSLCISCRIVFLIQDAHFSTCAVDQACGPQSGL
mmetsp:Transcript_30085/g.54420  ORF Transcript_30085/g.54420 Transcript_30085/m.54420 type:complete len:204 (-) Transcript_30085:1253-1864(-)